MDRNQNGTARSLRAVGGIVAPALLAGVLAVGAVRGDAPVLAAPSPIEADELQAASIIDGILDLIDALTGGGNDDPPPPPDPDPDLPGDDGGW